MTTPIEYRLTSHIETRLAILRVCLRGASEPVERESLIREIADLQRELESRQRAEKDPLHQLTKDDCCPQDTNFGNTCEFPGECDDCPETVTDDEAFEEAKVWLAEARVAIKCPASGTKAPDDAKSCYITCPNCCRRTKVTARGIIRPHNEEL